MKIMMVEPLDDGGIAHYAFNLVEALVQKHIETVLFTTKNYELSKKTSHFKLYPVMFMFAGFAIKRFPWLSHETYLPSLIRRGIKVFEYPFDIMKCLYVVKKEKITIVHFQTVNMIELMMIIALKLAGMKVVFTIHNVLPRHGKLRYYHTIIYRFMYALCDCLIIHSQNGKNEVVELFSVAPGKISVIPHGDYKFFLPKAAATAREAKASLGIRADTKAILFFGAIRPNKGLDNLLRALPRIKDRVPASTLMIIGEPCENYARYRELIEQERVSDSVFEKLEYVPNHEVAPYFIAADVVVLPYNEITQSGVLQIAYAFAKPVVATAIGGFNEAVEDGKNGYLVAPGSVELLADKISEIITDEAKSESMGRHSRFLSDTRYSWESIADSTLSLYEQLGEPVKQVI